MSDYEIDLFLTSILGGIIGAGFMLFAVYHHFKGKIDVSLASVANVSEDMFETREDFVKLSKQVATQLYNQSMHPKIKGGEFYVCFFKDAVVDGELCDAIGYFKTENKETFLKNNLCFFCSVIQIDEYNAALSALGHNAACECGGSARF